MPVKKKKKFIDKKNAVSFYLVHRSQKDPLQADDAAPQHVLAPMEGASGEDRQKNKEEERKFGVFYDDDYDYLQHLRDVEELHEVSADDGFRLIAEEKPPAAQGKINLPSSVFASTTETEVGMLNKAAPISGPRLDWDPDIVAGLDEDFDYDNPDNELDDDFIIQANDGQPLDPDTVNFDDGQFDDADENDEEVYKPVGYRPKIEVCDDDSEEEDDEDIASDDADFSDDEEDSAASDLGSLGDRSFGDVETKSRFTSYSMTSSVIRRTEGLTLLDERFEKLYAQYDDEDIGALDQEDIDGFLKPNSQVLNAAIEEFEKDQNKQTLKDAVKKATSEYVSDDEDVSDLVKMTIREPKEKWDCESILSTHSTLYNHPTLIKEPKNSKAIKLTKRAGIPAEVLPERGMTKKQQERMEQVDTTSLLDTHRPKDETAEERKERKQAVKDNRRIRRMEKKSNTMAFKAEKIRQDKEHLNIQSNLKGTSIT